MIIKQIDEDVFENFVKSSEMQSFYQSIKWKKFKENEGKSCELIGLFSNDLLVGVSLITYVSFFKKFKYAYASRGFVYDYSNISEFTFAIRKFFKGKKVAFVRIDPLVVLNSYDSNLKNIKSLMAKKVIDELKSNGFIHYGFNMAYETTQFRFIHRLNIENSYETQYNLMSKSTRKNIIKAEFMGVKSRKSDSIDEVLKFIEMTGNRKNFKELSKNFYLNLIDTFKDDVTLDIIYIDKKVYIDNLIKKVKSLEKELDELHEKFNHDNVGKKLKSQECLILQSISKYNEELKLAKKMEDITDIASIVGITCYDEIVAFASGMDNDYRKFNPKYVMYPELIKRAIDKNLKYVNFLGVKNIFDKNDSDYGIYEIKRGFGGETLEYIGEFDLPIKKLIYIFYKILERIKK